jgi:hypothetical protein
MILVALPNQKLLLRFFLNMISVRWYLNLLVLLSTTTLTSAIAISVMLRVLIIKLEFLFLYLVSHLGTFLRCIFFLFIIV